MIVPLSRFVQIEDEMSYCTVQSRPVRTRAANVIAVLLIAAAGFGCADASAESAEGDAEGEKLRACDAHARPTRFISCVQEFRPGPGAGVAADYPIVPGDPTPAVIAGPPNGAGMGPGGSTDVLSFGRGGMIVFGFGGNEIIDGPGPDLLVFENPFYIAGDPAMVYAELGEVSVSQDGQAWETFACHAAGYPFTGCAGWHRVLSNGANGLSPVDPAEAGGDPFDLADVGLQSARFVAIRDLSGLGASPTAGFDLDGAAIINSRIP